jgi:apolipoprotein N-acyltransferase
LQRRRELTARALRIAIAALAGAALAAAGPPYGAFPALWFAMAALAVLSERAAGQDGERTVRVSLLGLVFGTAANLVALRFVPPVVLRFLSVPTIAAWTGFVLLSVAQGVRFGATGLVYAALRRRAVPGPLAFATGTYVGTFVPAVFPWTPAAGVSQVPEMVQLAEWVGDRGVTFIMALSAGLLAAVIGPTRGAKERTRLVGIGVAIPALTYVLGLWRISAVEAMRAGAPTARVALVQPATNPLDRWNPDLAPTILASLTLATRNAEKAGAELTVWPEAAYPYVVAHASRRCPVGARAILPFGVRGPVLTGLVMMGGGGDTWNAASVCHADGVLDPPQDKVHLLWFGETIPYLDRMAWVRDTFTRGRGLVAGDEFVAEKAGRIKAAVLNCFEDTLPGAGREAMSVTPNLLVNVTNDGWFEGTDESELHLRLAVLRAIESRRDLVRAVNLGATSWIDAAGVIRARTTGSAPDVLMATPALLDTDKTLFDRAGDAPLAVLLAGLTLAAMRRGRQTSEKALSA